MRLYILRHGIAELRNIYSPSDEDRELTGEGREKMRSEAESMRAMGFIPDVILSSPLIRARQTAEILMEAFGEKVSLAEDRNLAPGGDRRELYRSIARYQKEIQGLMLVGHQPDLGSIAGEIACGYPDCYFDLKMGGMCVLDLDGIQDVFQGRLIALLTPAVLQEQIRGHNT